MAYRSAAEKSLGLTRLSAYGSGKEPVTATNRGVSRSMNSRAMRSPRAVRKRGDHALAGVDRHVTEAGSPLGFIRTGLGVDLNDDRNSRKLFDGRFDVLLE